MERVKKLECLFSIFHGILRHSFNFGIVSILSHGLIQMLLDIISHTFLRTIDISCSIFDTQRIRYITGNLEMALIQKGIFVLRMDTFHFPKGLSAFSGVMTVFGWQVVQNVAFVYVQKAPATKLNMGIAYAGPALGMLLCTFRSLQNIVFHVKAYRGTRSDSAKLEGGED